MVDKLCIIKKWDYRIQKSTQALFKGLPDTAQGFNAVGHRDWMYVTYGEMKFISGFAEDGL